MPSSDDVGRRADRAGLQAVAAWQAVLRALVLIQLGLVVACVAAPVLGIDENPNSSTGSGRASDVQPLTLLRGLLYYLSGTDESFGDLDANPFAVPGGRTLTIVGLGVLMVALALTIGSALAIAADVGGRAVPVLATVTGVVTILTTVLIAVAQSWLSNSELATPLQAGLWVPLGTGVWLLSLVRARRAWDEL